MNKYEQLIEFIINEQEDKAKALFHDIVVERSRDIYESLMDEEDPAVSDDQVNNLVDEITADDVGMREAEADEEMPADDMGMDHNEPDADNMGGPSDMDADNEEASVEDRVMDLEDAIDELKAEFDRLMADEAGEAEHNDGVNDPEFGDEQEGMGMDLGMEMRESADADEDDEEKEDKEDDTKAKAKSEAEKIREYVEKVSMPSNKSEGGEAGKGGSVAVNKGSVVAGKNNMGGTSANIAKGGSESAPDGTSPKSAVKGKGEFTGQFQNKPGARADMGKAPSAQKGEAGGINKTSIEAGGK